MLKSIFAVLIGFFSFSSTVSAETLNTGVNDIQYSFWELILDYSVAVFALFIIYLPEILSFFIYILAGLVIYHYFLTKYIKNKQEFDPFFDIE